MRLLGGLGAALVGAALLGAALLGAALLGAAVLQQLLLFLSPCLGSQHHAVLTCNALLSKLRHLL